MSQTINALEAKELIVKQVDPGDRRSRSLSLRVMGSASGVGWAPLDEQLGLQRGYAPDCQYFMAWFCGRQPYQESLDNFHEVFRADGKQKVSMCKPTR